MNNYDALVVETVPDNAYIVHIYGVFTGTVTDDGTAEDYQMSFESALSWAVELMLSDDYEITQTEEFVSRSTGRLCRRYTISVIEG